MPTEQDLKVGYIPYLNCAPFFQNLKACGFSGQIVSGVPSALNAMLQNGTLDISPSSSFEYALNNNDYLLLPEYSISSCGPVKSVLLFSPCPPEELQGHKIAITGESATSINLLRVILLEYMGLYSVDDYVPAETVETLISDKKPALLIGDRAMKQAESLPAGVQAYDLGELWYQNTGLPFVFALWILRRDSAQRAAEAVRTLKTQLDSSIRQAFSDLPRLAKDGGATDKDVTRLVDYWQTIDYTLTNRHLEGLNLFFTLCCKHQLLADLPKIEFFQSV